LTVFKLTLKVGKTIRKYRKIIDIALVSDTISIIEKPISKVPIRYRYRYIDIGDILSIYRPTSSVNGGTHSASVSSARCTVSCSNNIVNYRRRRVSRTYCPVEMWKSSAARLLLTCLSLLGALCSG